MTTVDDLINKDEVGRRIYNAISQVAASKNGWIEPDEWTLVGHPETIAKMLMDWDFRYDVDVMRFFGFLWLKDPFVPRGELRLRYEVQI